MEQALTNALLMDAVVGCLQSQKAIFAATKLAYFDKKKLEGVYHSLSAVQKNPIYRFLTVALQFVMAERASLTVINVGWVIYI